MEMRFSKLFDQRTNVWTLSGLRSTVKKRPDGPWTTAFSARMASANQSGKKATRSVRREALMTFFIVSLSFLDRPMDRP